MVAAIHCTGSEKTITVPAVGETLVTDGRVNRAARTRAAVVDALLSLIHQGNLRPTGRQIADEAGVSLRSVYVHFDDVESLFIAAAARHHERMEALYTPCVTTGSLEERIAALIERRRPVFEDAAMVRRAALLQEPFSPVLKRALDLGRVALRADIEKVFATELGAVAEGERPRLRAALEIATSPGTWDVLRAQQNLSVDEAAALVHDMVRAVVDGWDPPAPSTGAPPPTTEPGPPG